MLPDAPVDALQRLPEVAQVHLVRCFHVRVESGRPVREPDSFIFARGLVTNGVDVPVAVVRYGLVFETREGSIRCAGKVCGLICGGGGVGGVGGIRLLLLRLCRLGGLTEWGRLLGGLAEWRLLLGL